MDELKNRFRAARFLEQPELWDRVEERAGALPKGGTALPSRTPAPRERLIAGAVALVVFLAAGAFALYAFRSGTPGRIGPSPRPSAGPRQGVPSWTVRVDADATVPAFADGSVFIGDGTGHLEALGASDGRLLWRARVPEGNSGQSIPVSAGTEVFEQTGKSLSAFDASSGRLLWTRARSDYRVSQNGTLERRSSGNVVASGGTVFETSVGQGLIALDAGTGAVVWRQPTAGTSVAGVTTDGTSIFVVSGTSSGPPAGFFGGVVAQAFAADDGTQLWTRALPPALSVNEAPVVAEGLLFLFSNNSVTYALDATTGATQYTSPSVLYFSQAGVSVPVAFGAKMTANGAVVAFTIRTGMVVWSSLPPRTGPDLPVAAGSVVVASGQVLDARTGRLLEVFGKPGEYVSDAAVGGGSAFVLAGRDLAAYRLP